MDRSLSYADILKQTLQIDTILFHARLVDRHVIIEEDNFEEGLTPALIATGIQPGHIITSLDYQIISAKAPTIYQND